MIFVWDRVNFPDSSSYGSIFCICDQNSVDNTWIFSLLLSSAYTALRFFTHTLLLRSERAVRTRGCEGTQPGQLAPADHRDIPWVMLSYKIGGRNKEEGKGSVTVWHLSSQVAAVRDGVLFSWDGWTGACSWEVGNEFFSTAWLAHRDFA